jgi:hypothetical protein
LIAQENNIATIVGLNTLGGHSPIGVGMSTVVSNVLLQEGTSLVIPSNFIWISEDNHHDCVFVDVEFDGTLEEMRSNFHKYYYQGGN